MSEPRPAFRSTVEARTSGETTTVTVSIRTPAGDLPVQRAELRDLSVQQGDSPAKPGSVSFTPGIHGCTFTFDVAGTGPFDLTAVAVLMNPDGSIWATLPIEDSWPRR